MQEMQVPSLGQEDPLEKDMATHSSILPWEIPWTEEPGRLQSMGSQKSQTQLSDQTSHQHITEKNLKKKKNTHTHTYLCVHVWLNHLAVT